MNYIVFDAEWNQPCSKRQLVVKPVYMPSEIIQIGAVKLDDRFSPAGTLSLNVKPKYYTKMQSHIKRLTGIDNHQLSSGIPFPAAFRQLRDFCGEEFCFLTWGNDDLTVFKDNLAVHGLDVDWVPAVYNLQVTFRQQLGGEQTQLSLTAALEKFGIDHTESAHDALADAAGTAELCRHLDMPRGFAEYSSCTDILLIAQDCRSESFLGFADLDAVLASPVLPRFSCPVCGKELSARRWARQNGKNFVSYASCPGCSDWFLKLHCDDLTDDAWMANRRVFPGSPAMEEYYAQKLEKQEQQEKARLARQQAAAKRRAQHEQESGA